MARQLTLIESDASWHLDQVTRDIGRRGVASARAQLAAHRPTEPVRRSAPDRSDAA